MQIHKKISRLRSYFEATWVSVRFYFMLRKMNRLRAESTENRKGILWCIFCSLISVHGIYTFIKGYVEMMEGKVGGIKMMTEGTGVAITATTMKQYGGILIGTKVKEKRGLKSYKRFWGLCRNGKEEHGFFCNINIRALGTESKAGTSP